MFPAGSGRRKKFYQESKEFVHHERSLQPRLQPLQRQLRKPRPQHEPPHAKSHIKKVIGVVSGKGGVGKSMTSAMLAVSMRRLGYKVGILDADITGPSIPKLFGVRGPARGTEDGILPVKSRVGIDIMSINLLLEDEEAPVVWRGPVIAGAVKQFWQDVIWEDVDFLFVDMPPGTGDVPLTVFQTLPVDGIIIVSSPQELVGMIVGKAVQMAQMMHVPTLGIVENMSYASAPTAASTSRCSATAMWTRPPRSTVCRCWPRCPLTLSWPRRRTPA